MSRNRHYTHDLEGQPLHTAGPTMYGFNWGAARVTRMSHVEGRYHVLAVDTPYRHVQVAVSPTGRSVRVWIDGEEVKR